MTRFIQTLEPWNGFDVARVVNFILVLLYSKRFLISNIYWSIWVGCICWISDAHIFFRQFKKPSPCVILDNRLSRGSGNNYPKKVSSITKGKKATRQSGFYYSLRCFPPTFFCKTEKGAFFYDQFLFFDFWPRARLAVDSFLESLSFNDARSNTKSQSINDCFLSSRLHFYDAFLLRER